MNAHVAAERAESAGVSGDWHRPISGGDGVGVCPGAEPHSLLSFIVLHCQGVVFPTRRHGCCRFI